MNNLNNLVFTLAQDLVLNEESTPYLLTLPKVIRSDYKEPVLQENNILVIDANKEVLLSKIFSPGGVSYITVKAVYIELGDVVHYLDNVCSYKTQFSPENSDGFGFLEMNIEEGFVTINNKIYTLNCIITSSFFSLDQSIEPLDMPVNFMELSGCETCEIENIKDFNPKLIGYELAVVFTNAK